MPAEMTGEKNAFIILTLRSTTRVMITLIPGPDLGKCAASIAYKIANEQKNYLTLKDFRECGANEMYLDGQRHIECQMVKISDIETCSISWEKNKK